MCAHKAIDRLYLYVVVYLYLCAPECRFERLGGNGIMLADYVRDATISGSEFVWMGDRRAHAHSADSRRS